MGRALLTLVLSMLLYATAWADHTDKADTASTHKGSWTTTSTPTLKEDLKYYDNWSASGNSSMTLTNTFFGEYKYTHPKYIWDNVADLAYGTTWQDLVKDSTQRGFETFDSKRKSEDKISLTTTFSMRLKKNWNLSASADFKSQFGDGYKYASADDNDRTKVSAFMAPAYLTTAIGFENKHDSWSISMSFLTGKTTFVCDDSLIATGYNYGVIQKDSTTFTHHYFGLGSYVKFFLKKDVAKNLNLYTRVELFYDYRKPDLLDWNHLDQQLADGAIGQEQYDEMAGRGFIARRAYETDVDFETTINYKFNAWLAAYLSLNLKYDTDFAGKGQLDRWQIYQSAGIQLYFNWKTPKQ